ncbi:MAG: CRP-like cAMP-binding protein [Thermoproteota archaeon]|jgi:CRP-like cAMP-binding protein
MSLSLDDRSDVNDLKIEKGSVLFKTGDACEFLYIVKSGEVCSFTAQKGQIVPLFVSKAAEFVGDQVAATEKEHTCNAVALMDSELVRVPSKDIAAYLAAAPAWIRSVVEIIGERVVETEHIISEHKIRDDKLTLGKELEPEKLALLTKALKD